MEIFANRNESCDREDNVIKIYSQKSGETDWNSVDEVKEYCGKRTFIPVSRWTRRILVIFYINKKSKFKGFEATYQISDDRGNNRFQFD